jgi:hypothetical protein
MPTAVAAQDPRFVPEVFHPVDHRRKREGDSSPQRLPNGDRFLEVQVSLCNSGARATGRVGIGMHQATDGDHVPWPAHCIP